MHHWAQYLVEIRADHLEIKMRADHPDEVDEETHTDAFGDFPQLRAAGPEQKARQPIPAKLSI
jgi:hypothetical protein